MEAPAGEAGRADCCAGARGCGFAGSGPCGTCHPRRPPSRPVRRPRPSRLTKAELRRQKKEEKRKRDDEKKQKAFQDYFDYTEQLKKIPPHRVLAINRGERAKVLRVKIEADVEDDAQCGGRGLRSGRPSARRIPARLCPRDALVRLILPSLEREVRREMTDQAETHAVEVFAKNLRNLLLQPPVRDRRVLAVDPGYKSGCKLVALDQFGNILDHGLVYLVGRAERRGQARRRVIEMIDHFGLTVVAIGNGTASRETEDFFDGLVTGELKDRDVRYVIVNEAWGQRLLDQPPGPG